MVQAGIREIVYDQPFDYVDDLEGTYQSLLAQSGVTMRQHAYSQAHPQLARSAAHSTGPEMPPDA
jgi:deoxycytidylate deaminase